ncbi:MAG: ATP-dependent 6-phosphofructokinase [Victivallaceae bacterium]|nr:ATP-dependent 6-phosphofructokinase [Victivallaceae bacterium]
MTQDDFKIEKLGKCTLDSPVRDMFFVDDNELVTYETNPAAILKNHPIGFERAGARKKIFHDPAWSKAAILTAGGLCPGLNDVIRALVLALQKYGVPVIYGIRYGYRGLNPEHGLEPLLLTPEIVDGIHHDGGTILGSSRGEEKTEVIVDTLARMNINILFCIGGDGTARGAHAIVQEIKRRKLSISVITIPKTIDNDISFIDQSFGFATAVMEAEKVISCAHVEAKGAYNGVGLVKVMGRDSGWIAAFTTLANPFVNYCLVPEEDFQLEKGSHALLPNLVERLAKKHHAVILVAEGAGQELFKKKSIRRDASGNILKDDIGVLLKSEITRYMKKNGIDVTVKYFDPGYEIRSVCAVGEDAVFCNLLANAAVQAAMAGRTDMIVGHWAGNFTHVPIPLATSARKKIPLDSTLWSCVKTTVCF